jgi:hypothetical protein
MIFGLHVCLATSGAASMTVCLACRAEMRLLEVVQIDPISSPSLERHTFRCSACLQVAHRLLFSRAREPTIDLPVVTQRPTPLRHEAPAKKCPMVPVAPASAWTTAIEKLRRSQADLKERAQALKAGAATASAPDTTSEFNRAMRESGAIRVVTHQQASRLRPQHLW